MTLPSTILVNGYSEPERAFIVEEFNSLKKVRQEEYTKDTLREWVKAFWENGYTANQVCKRIRAVKEAKIYGKVTYADFINADIDETPDIVPVAVKDEFLYLLITCSTCGKSTTLQKKDLFTFKQVKICEHKIVDGFALKNLYGQVKTNYQEFEL